MTSFGFVFRAFRTHIPRARLNRFFSEASPTLYPPSSCFFLFRMETILLKFWLSHFFLGFFFLFCRTRRFLSFTIDVSYQLVFVLIPPSYLFPTLSAIPFPGATHPQVLFSTWYSICSRYRFTPHPGSMSFPISCHVYYGAGSFSFLSPFFLGSVPFKILPALPLFLFPNLFFSVLSKPSTPRGLHFLNNIYPSKHYEPLFFGAG